MGHNIERPATGADRGGPSASVSGQGQADDTRIGKDVQPSRPIIIATLAKNSRETLRVALDHYRGCDLVDVRVCVALSASSGLLTPTAKGVSLDVAKLPALAEAVTAALAKARELNLIGEAAQ